MLWKGNKCTIVALSLSVQSDRKATEPPPSGVSTPCFPLLSAAYLHPGSLGANLKETLKKRGKKHGLCYKRYFFSVLTSLSGIIHQMKAEYEAALKFHKAHLSFAQELSDYAAQGRAYGNMGNAYHALGIYDQAVRYHRQELQISLEVSCSAVHRSCGSSRGTVIPAVKRVLGERSAISGFHAW